MKLITTTFAAILIATTSFAGEVSMSSAAHLPAEAAPMGATSAQWIIPLLALAIIALALSADDPCAGGVTKANYDECGPDEIPLDK